MFQKLMGQLALYMAETKRETLPQYKVDRESQLLQTVLQPPHMRGGTPVPHPVPLLIKRKGLTFLRTYN